MFAYDCLFGVRPLHNLELGPGLSSLVLGEIAMAQYVKSQQLRAGGLHGCASALAFSWVHPASWVILVHE